MLQSMEIQRVGRDLATEKQQQSGRKDWTFKESFLSSLSSTLLFWYDILGLFFFFLTLQYCISFAKYRNESATGIPAFPILNPPPSSLPSPPTGSSQCTSPKHPVLCIEPRLATRFIHDIIHVSMLFSYTRVFIKLIEVNLHL